VNGTIGLDSIPVLRAENLVKTHHGAGAPAHAVRGVNLHVRQGEFVAITGPSGAGKSTLLHLLGGLQRRDSGSIWLAGERTDGHTEARWAAKRRRRIGIVFQFFNLVSNLSVADNVELPALLAGVSPKRARAERAELLAELGLQGKERSMPGELSGGQQQRVALARALVNHPALLLADEPAGSLDTKGTHGRTGRRGPSPARIRPLAGPRSTRRSGGPGQPRPGPACRPG
jgi:putative ABC transport system ATP-binding protein